jgi:hypothetical protein
MEPPKVRFLRFLYDFVYGMVQCVHFSQISECSAITIELFCLAHFTYGLNLIHKSQIHPAFFT